MFIQQDISWLWSREEDREGDADDGEIRRDNITSVGNTVGVLTNSLLKLQFPHARRKIWVATETKKEAPCPGYPFSAVWQNELLSDKQPVSICIVLHCLLRS